MHSHVLCKVLTNMILFFNMDPNVGWGKESGICQLIIFQCNGSVMKLKNISKKG